MATETIANEIVPEPLDGRYQLDGVIGRGGMGTVYRARDLRLDRLVAVKILRGADGADEQRFAAEIRILARLVHPSLVRILDAGELEARPYLVMDLIEGPNLAQRLSAGPLSPPETAKIGASMAAALAYVHDAGIVHRDVKPANVLLDREGGAHLADFGIARLADTTGLTITGLTLGTPAYLAPEQIEGTEVGPSADVYSLGLVLLECLSGQRAFVGTPSEVAGARLHRDPEIPAGLGEEWGDILSTMTARTPGMRRSAATAATQLGRLAHGHVDTVLSAPTPWLYDEGALTVPFALDETRVFAETATQLPAKSAAVVIHRWWRRTTRRGATPLVVAMSVVVLVAGLAFAISWWRSPSTATGSTSPATVTTVSTPASTSTSVPPSTVPLHPVATAASAVDTAIANGVANGTITTPAGQQLTSLLNPLLSTASTAQPSQQIQQFNQFVQQVTQLLQNGQIVGTSTIASLTVPIDALAKALGTTTPNLSIGTPSGVSGKGHGHGHGTGP